VNHARHHLPERDLLMRVARDGASSMHQRGQRSERPPKRGGTSHRQIHQIKRLNHLASRRLIELRVDRRINVSPALALLFESSRNLSLQIACIAELRRAAACFIEHART